MPRISNQEQCPSLLTLFLYLYRKPAGYWTGLVKVRTSPLTLRWLDGTPVGIIRWAEHEPDNEATACVRLKRQQFSDVPCGLHSAFICEMGRYIFISMPEEISRIKLLLKSCPVEDESLVVWATEQNGLRAWRMVPWSFLIAVHVPQTLSHAWCNTQSLLAVACGHFSMRPLLIWKWAVMALGGWSLSVAWNGRRLRYPYIIEFTPSFWTMGTKCWFVSDDFL